MSLLKTKLEAASRILLTHSLSGVLPLYVVTEYPRSGGSWFSQMLSEYLGVPFPRNRFPVLRPSVMHGHFLYSSTIRNVFVICRDGRDVAISMYYHCLFENDRYNRRLVRETRRSLPFKDYEDIDRNLPDFIEFLFTRNRHPRFSWAEFMNSWSGKGRIIVKYEDLLQDTAAAFAEALRNWSGDEPDLERIERISQRFSFKNQTKRRPGQEKIGRFLRKGIAGDWKNHFSRKACKTFESYAGRELVLLGYEKDHSWTGCRP